MLISKNRFKQGTLVVKRRLSKQAPVFFELFNNSRATWARGNVTMRDLGEMIVLSESSHDIYYGDEHVTKVFAFVLTHLGTMFVQSEFLRSVVDRDRDEQLRRQENDSTTPDPTDTVTR